MSDLNSQGIENKILRGLYMLLFFMIFQIIEVFVIVIMVVQWLVTIFSGEANEDLKRFGGNLSSYTQQVIAFISYKSEEKPYPFMDWPVDKDIKKSLHTKNNRE